MTRVVGIHDLKLPENHITFLIIRENRDPPLILGIG